MYSQEYALVDDFVAQLPSSPFAQGGSIVISTEFDYSRGRADIIAMTDEHEIIAFEAKLKNWREALHQAYRNTCFAHYSYVILPEKIALRAVQFEMEFYERCVGICYIEDGEIIVVYEARKTTPVQNWLVIRAQKTLAGLLEDEQDSGLNYSR